MHIENLRFFYEVAQAKSISTVAKASHISQSALSQQLLKLEDNFNVKLLIRSNKGVSLTKEGQTVYTHCESILNTYSKMLEELDSVHNDNSLVTIDGIDIVTSTLLPLTINKLTRFFPKYKFKVISSECNSNNIIHNVADINISYNHYHDSNEIITKELCSDSLIFIASPQFKKDKLTLDEFFKTSLILVNDKLNIKRLLTKRLELHNTDFSSLPILFTASTYNSALIGLSNNNVLTTIPLSIYNAYYKNLGYKHIEVEGLNFPLTMYISYTEQLYKREKYFIDKFTSILKGFLKF